VPSTPSLHDALPIFSFRDLTQELLKGHRRQLVSLLAVRRPALRRLSPALAFVFLHGLADQIDDRHNDIKPKLKAIHATQSYQKNFISMIERIRLDRGRSGRIFFFELTGAVIYLCRPLIRQRAGVGFFYLLPLQRMQLAKLEIKGFKSFADKVVINFDEGITGIVGPNGCGKSNVVDSIRWVLGEQKTSALRSEKMENVIFNGTSHRAPQQMAEVSLTINNTKNNLPTEYSQVTITRRRYRSGDSEYLLNGVTCRLKDI